MKRLIIKPRNFNGDTIVEVLIAIAVAAFAIGTSYAIANKSLERAIAARERNEALNIIQNQISDLKVRFKSDPAFNTNFAVRSSFVPSVFPATDFNFCLDDSATSTTSTNWARINNNFTSSTAANNLNTGAGGYDPKCLRTNSSYYVNIEAQVTSSSQNATNRTVYRVAVRWAEIGSNTTAQAAVYYRVGGSPGIASIIVPPPPPPPLTGCTPQESVGVPHDAVSQLYYLGPTQYRIDLPQPLDVCTGIYSFSVTTWDESHCGYAPLRDCTGVGGDVARPEQKWEEVFLELYNKDDPVPVYRTDFTDDIDNNKLNSVNSFPGIAIAKQVDYIIVKHCSIGAVINPGRQVTCRLNANSVHGVDITITPGI